MLLIGPSRSKRDGWRTTLFQSRAETVCDQGADLRERNDFYFLLRVAHEAESR